MKALVVGYGSVGKRHARLLSQRGCSVGVVSRRDVEVEPRYPTLESAFENQVPRYVVVANRTAEHVDTLKELSRLSFSGKVLVEKPLAERTCRVPDDLPYDAFVAYNFRFHPILRALRQRLGNETIVSVDAYAGQYLPDWRPGRDYRQTYSAHQDKGGGVLRDLSHELDYLTWILGGWNRVAALGGQFSSLEIDSDDVFTLLLETPRCPATVLQLNYLDRDTHRTVRVNTSDHTFELNLIENVLSIDGKQLDSRDIEADRTYRKEHEALLEGATETLCTLEQGKEVMELIEAAERSATTHTWIENNTSE